MVTSAVYHYGFSAFFIPWRESFGWSRAILAGVVGMSRLEGGLVAPVAGWFIDKYGPRRIMFLGLVMMGGGFFALSRVNSLLMLYVVFIALLATGASFGTGRPVQVAVANWFVRRRGLTLGLLTAGSGIGGSLVFLFAMVVDSFGWRAGAIAAGLIMWGIGFPLALIIRHRPEQMGLLPDGDRIPSSRGVTVVAGREDSMSRSQIPAATQGINPKEIDSASSPILRLRRLWKRDPRPEIDLTMWQALRTQAFWLTVLTWATWATMPGISTVHIAPFLSEELGLDFVVALGALSFFAASSVIGRIGFGLLADYMNIRLLVAGLLLMQGIGMLLFSQVQTLAQVPFYIIVFALPYGGTLTMRPVITGYFFGRKNFGTIGGLLQFVELPAIVIAPVWVGWMADALTDGYRIAFRIMAVILIIGAVFILLSRRPRPPLPVD